jgi:HEAT repeat protein
MGRETLIAKLKEDIAQGRVVVIAGTGVSVAACGNQKVEGYAVATWVGLLQHGVQHCKDIGAADEADAELLTMQIKSCKTNFLISAAEDISQRMKAKAQGVFLGWLKDTIGKLKVEDRAALDALAALPGVLATLNYDGLIEEATGRHPVTWLKTDAVQDVLQRVTTDAVLHLHGWFKEPESVVLGLSSYLAVKDHPHAKAVLNLFTLDRTLLFVGCGDTVLDPNFTRLIEWGTEALSKVAPRHYLLCRTSEIPDFKEKLAGASWLRPLDYGGKYEDLVPFLRGLAPAVGTAAPAKPGAPAGPGFDLAAYQQAMRKLYVGLKLEEIDATTHDIRRLTLTGMFIAQSARECAEFMPRLFELPKELQRRLRDAGEIQGAQLDDEALAKHRSAYFDQSPRPIREIVSDQAFKRLVILGDPGSGKSTLLQYLLLQWAERAAPDPARDPLPLLIELREYSRLRHEGRVDGFLGYLHGGASARWHFDQAQLDAWLRANPSLVLFDGLDEIFDPTLRREISTAIHRFADEYPLARLIVTSRIVGYQHQTWRDENFRHFMLQELDEAQIADFLARWHRAAYEEPARAETKRALLARGIADSVAIRQLAGNPLLLTMMAILNRTQDLPRDRAELYEQCSRLLLHQWKVDSVFSSYPELANASLDFKDKRGLLLRVARSMQSSERGLAGNLIDAATLEATLQAGLKDIPNLRADRAARALIEQLRGRNFMLCFVGGNSYAFVHRTFLEYFCAVEICERFHAQKLTKEKLKTEIFSHWADETWHEVLCLLAGMIPGQFVAEILKWLLAQPDPDETSRHILLAARCVGEVRKRGELGVAEEEILERTKGLIQLDVPNELERSDPMSMVYFHMRMTAPIRERALRLLCAVWLRANGTRTYLQALTHHPYDDSAIPRIAVQELAEGWKDDLDTLPWLKALAQSDKNSGASATAIHELAGRWKDDPETLPILKALAQSDKIDRGLQASAVQKLAAGWKDDPETLPILKALAQSAGSEKVRRSALQELTAGWKDDPETLPILKALTQPDESYWVREIAVEQLAHWKEDPETLLMLKALAQSDESYAVRECAVQELARGWNDDPETLPWLKALAQSNKDSNVRISTVKELARGWKDDPETLPILKALAQSDEDPFVRRSAVEELARWKDDSDVRQFLSDLETEA